MLISREINFFNEEIIYQNLNESDTIIIKFFEESNGQTTYNFFILSFKNSIMFFDQNCFDFLYRLLSFKKELNICFMPKTKEQFDEYIKIIYNKNDYNSIFEDEIKSFNNQMILTFSLNKQLGRVWKIVKSCITGYLIKQSYFQTKKNRYKFFPRIKRPTFEIIPNESIIILRTINEGSVFLIDLIYHIEKERLLAIKKPKFKDIEIPKLIERETDNYRQIHHPLIPKFIGKLENKDYIVIEYINGQNLLNIGQLKLSFKEKVKIIFELMLIIEYFHRNNYIIRDIKPNNIIIDENKTLVLIDFDRLLNDRSISSKTNYTHEFSSIYAPNESDSNHISSKWDIYSLGQMMYFIMNEKDPNISGSNEISSEEFMNKLYHFCTLKDIERPTITELIKYYYSYYKSFIDLNEFNIETRRIVKRIYVDYLKERLKSLELKEEEDENEELGIKYMNENLNDQIISTFITLAEKENNLDACLSLGYLYFNGIYLKQDINKAIYYYSLIASRNCIASYMLGLIYYMGIYVHTDINKAISYFSLGANLNDSNSQLALGTIYSEGVYVPININKAICYFTLSANQNNTEALANLAEIYYDGVNISQDINKAVYYYTLAANNNHEIAQYNLGCHYYNGEHSPIDIEKAIHYFTLSANQDYAPAQFNLGLIYNNGHHVPVDISKAVYYYRLAANKNIKEAQCNLGNIYENKYNDIEKAIYYYELAANQNDEIAQLNLGSIYLYNQKYMNIEKAIYYYKLSAENNCVNARILLGRFYLFGEFVAQDIKLGIYYFRKAADINHHEEAQCLLGFYYYFMTESTAENKKNAITYFIRSAQKRYNYSSFLLGYLHHFGENVHEKIKDAIHYYKEASSFNFQYAKNNLGIIYKNGFGDEIPKNIGLAKEYFNEAVNKSNDYLSMFNLAKIYIFDEPNEKYHKKIIELLTNSFSLGFKHSIFLLSSYLFKKYGLDLSKISAAVPTKFRNEVINIIQYKILADKNIDDTFRFYQNTDYIYDKLLDFTELTDIKHKNNRGVHKRNKYIKDINKEFYDGFGIPI